MMLMVSRPSSISSSAGELAGELGRPHLAAPHGEQQLDPLGDRRDPAGERHPVDAERVSRRQQHVVEPVGLRCRHDVTAVRPRRPKCGVGYAEVLVVVVTQRREPGDLRTAAPRSVTASPRRVPRRGSRTTRRGSARPRPPGRTRGSGRPAGCRRSARHRQVAHRPGEQYGRTGDALLGGDAIADPSDVDGTQITRVDLAAEATTVRAGSRRAAPCRSPCTGRVCRR